MLLLLGSFYAFTVNSVECFFSTDSRENCVSQNNCEIQYDTVHCIIVIMSLYYMYMFSCVLSY